MSLDPKTVVAIEVLAQTITSEIVHASSPGIHNLNIQKTSDLITGFVEALHVKADNEKYADGFFEGVLEASRALNKDGINGFLEFSKRTLANEQARHAEKKEFLRGMQAELKKKQDELAQAKEAN